MLVTVCVSNFTGIALMLMIIIANRELYTRKGTTKYLMNMTVITMLSCLADIVAYAFDGRPGFISAIVIYIVNSWLYLAVPLISIFWFRLMCDYIGVQIPPTGRLLLLFINSIVVFVLIMNIFMPLVFKLENNVYERQGFYWIFVVIGACNISYGLYLYYMTTKKTALLVSFSVTLFIIPLIIGTAVQSLFYGISVIWVSAAIAIVGMVSSMKNGLIYIDRMTEVYNRYYLEKIKNDISKKPDVKMTGIMIDLNRFKSINDKFGHKAGDEALINAAGIIMRAVGYYGKVIRYTGDEFIVIINSTDEALIDSISADINYGFDDFNKKTSGEYRLTASLARHELDLRRETIDEFVNTLDAKMTEKKVKHRAEFD